MVQDGRGTMERAVTRVITAAKPKVLRRPPYTWTPQHELGFGRTPRQRLHIDLAKLFRLHGVDERQETDALVLASFVLAVLDARRVSMPEEEGVNGS